MKFNINLFKKHLYEAEIALPRSEIKGSLTYLDYGLRIRERLYSIGKDALANSAFKELKLSDIIPRQEVLKLDQISPVSHNYFNIEGTCLAMSAGHETPFYVFLKEYLRSKNSVEFPLKFYHFGSVYRYPKNTKFPFNLGERRSFLECYVAYNDVESENSYFQMALSWNRNLIKEILHIPTIEVERPLLTNKPFSQKTICLDSITPLGITVITGMTYLHGDIFTSIFNVKSRNKDTKKNEFVRAVHFGISDNLFFSYLLNSHDDRGFRMLSVLAPYHVSILLQHDLKETGKLEIAPLLDYLKANNIRHEIKTVTQRRQRVCIEENVVKGISATIAVNSGGELSINPRTGQMPYHLQSDNFGDIKKIILAQDTEIIASFEERQRDSIIHCQTTEDVNSVIRTGKVARIFLSSFGDAVARLESMTDAGEILGFNTCDNTGIDILSLDMTDSIAYVSRRS